MELQTVTSPVKEPVQVGETITEVLDQIEVVSTSRPFIEANTIGATLNEINNSHIIPVFVKENEPAISQYVTKAVEYLSPQGLTKSRFVESGALLVACIAGSIESVGRASLTDRKVAFNQQINAIQPNQYFNSIFLYWLFRNSKKYIQNHATDGMKKILTKGEFEKIKMIKPPIELQNDFAQVVEKAETLKIQYRLSLKELENLYRSLSQLAFNGELDLRKVPVDDDDLPWPEPGGKRYGDPFEGIEGLPTDGRLFGAEEFKKLMDTGKWELVTQSHIHDTSPTHTEDVPEGDIQKIPPHTEHADVFETDITKMSLDDWYGIPYEIREQYGSIEERKFDWEFFLRKYFSDRTITTDEVARVHYIYQYPRGYDFDYEEFASVVFDELKKKDSFLDQKFNPETKQLELIIDEAAKAKNRYRV